MAYDEIKDLIKSGDKCKYGEESDTYYLEAIAKAQLLILEKLNKI